MKPKFATEELRTSDDIYKRIEEFVNFFNNALETTKGRSDARIDNSGVLDSSAIKQLVLSRRPEESEFINEMLVKMIRRLRDNTSRYNPEYKSISFESLFSDIKTLKSTASDNDSIKLQLSDLEAFYNQVNSVPDFDVFIKFAKQHQDNDYLALASTQITNMHYRALDAGTLVPNFLARKANGLGENFDDRAFNKFNSNIERICQIVFSFLYTIDVDEKVTAVIPPTSYSGPVFDTYNGSVKAKFFSLLASEGKTLLDFVLNEQYRVITLIGYRIQFYTSAKVSALISGHRIYLGKTVNGDDVANHLRDFNPKYSNEVSIDTKGKIGGRVRPINNVDFIANASLIGIVQLLHKYGSQCYQVIFTQEFSNMATFSCGRYSYDMYTQYEENYELPSVKILSKMGCDAKYLSEHTYAFGGDVSKYDATCSRQLLDHLVRYLFSSDVEVVNSKIFQSLTFGAYSDRNNYGVAYGIDYSIDSDKLNSLPSGSALTSLFGKIPMSALNLAVIEIMLDKYANLQAHGWPSAADFLDAEIFISRKYDYYYNVFSVSIRCGGDDHAINSAVLAKLCNMGNRAFAEKFQTLIAELGIVKIEREIPLLCCGFEFTADERNNDLVTVGLRRNPRSFLNKSLYPERARSALGLYSAIKLYQTEFYGDDKFITDTVKVFDTITESILTSYKVSFEALEAQALKEKAFIEANPELVSPRVFISMKAGIPYSKIDQFISESTIESLIQLGIPDDVIRKIKQDIPSDVLDKVKAYFNLSNFKRK